MVRTAGSLFFVTALLAVVTVAKAQDPHFAGVADMKIWYNPALKTNKIPDAYVNIRSVNYPNIISYTSKAVTIELPLISRDRQEDDNIFFMNVAAGISTNNSSDNFMNLSTSMLALSYALPLNNDNTCIAIGFQGAYTFSRIGASGTYQFPDRFDRYGALLPAVNTDPFESGFNYGFFIASAGVALFQSLDERQWYIGGSVLQFNHPFTEWTHSARLPSNYGVQAAYNTAISNSADVGGYGYFTWQSGLIEQTIGAHYTRKLGDSTINAISFGIGYQVGDAVIPNVGLKAGYNMLAFYYEINMPGITASNYHRRSCEFSYRRNL